MESSNLIERYEYKYLIPERLVKPIRQTAQTFCTPDEHADADGSYTIRSLYFDTDRFQLYWANEREQADRFKLRVRTYPGKKAPVFLEVKRRVYDVILKTRSAVPADKWRGIVEGTLPPSAAYGGKAGKRAAEFFVIKVMRHHIRPKMLVEYDREAYESTIDDYARLTFDRRVRCQSMHELSLEADPKRWRPIDNPAKTMTIEPICVLELKFENVPPSWMVKMVRRLDLMRFSFSKYCYSVDAQLLLPEPRAVIPAWERID